MNEDKVLRDASGVFRGKVEGGVLTVVDDPAIPPYTPPVARGKFRLNFKDGRQRGSTTHPLLDGDDSVDLAGSFKKLDVRRGGRQVAVSGKGTADDDSNDFGVWSNGTATGVITEQGPKWKGNGVMGGLRNFIGDPMSTLDDFTEKMTGFKASGES